MTLSLDPAETEERVTQCVRYDNVQGDLYILLWYNANVTLRLM
jgi:hypothetical protein